MPWSATELDVAQRLNALSDDGTTGNGQYAQSVVQSAIIEAASVLCDLPIPREFLGVWSKSASAAISSGDVITLPSNPAPRRILSLEVLGYELFDVVVDGAMQPTIGGGFQPFVEVVNGSYYTRPIGMFASQTGTIHFYPAMTNTIAQAMTVGMRLYNTLVWAAAEILSVPGRQLNMAALLEHLRNAGIPTEPDNKAPADQERSEFDSLLSLPPALLNRGQEMLIARHGIQNIPDLYTSESFALTQAAPTAQLAANTWEDKGCKVRFGKAGATLEPALVSPVPTQNPLYQAVRSNDLLTFTIPTGSPDTYTALITHLLPYRSVLTIPYMQVGAVADSTSIIRWPLEMQFATNELVGSVLRIFAAADWAIDYPITANTHTGSPAREKITVGANSHGVPCNRPRWKTNTLDSVTTYPAMIYRLLLPPAMHAELLEWCAAQMTPPDTKKEAKK